MIEKNIKDRIEVISRGIPPYLVYGFEVPDMGPRHAERVNTFEDVIAKMFDITSGGKELKGQYATDVNGTIIFDTSKLPDIEILNRVALHPNGLDALIIR